LRNFGGGDDLLRFSRPQDYVADTVVALTYPAPLLAGCQSEALNLGLPETGNSSWYVVSAIGVGSVTALDATAIMERLSP
jgi:hypothetical protein